MNKTNYSLASTQSTDSPAGVAYQNATGHAPQIFKGYWWNVESEAKQIIQIDNIVLVGTSKLLNSNWRRKTRGTCSVYLLRIS